MSTLAAPTVLRPDRAATAIHAAARILDERADVYAREIADRVHRRMPEFGGAVVTAQSRAAVRAGISAYARMLLRGTSVEDAPIPAEAIEYARAFVRRGVGLPELLRTYRLGHEELWSVWSALLAEGGHPPELLLELQEQTAASMFAFMDRLSGSVLAEYDDERRRWVRSAEALRLETVQALLHGDVVDATEASGILRYELARWHVAFTLWTEDDACGERLQRAARELALRVGDAHPLVVGAPSNGVWVWAGLIRAPDDRLLRDVVGAGPLTGAVSFAMGEGAQGPDGFRRSHEEAVAGRRLSALVAGTPPSVTRWADVALLGLLSTDAERGRHFVVRELGALDADDDTTAMLRATLVAYLDAGDSASVAAQRLGVHQNTVRNRLHRCRELLDRPLDRRRLELRAALLLRDAVGHVRED